MGERRFPELVTERLVLSVPSLGAGPRLLAFYVENRAHLERWSPPFPDGFFTERFWTERVRAFREEFRAGTSVRFAIAARDDPGGAILGVVNFSQIVRGPFQACYLGYSVAARAEGRGVMFEALTEALGYAFTEQQLHRVMANYIPTNERSGRLLRRLGFVVEGYARDYLFIAGAWRDHVLTSLTSAGLAQPRGYTTGGAISTGDPSRTGRPCRPTGRGRSSRRSRSSRSTDPA